MGTGLTSSLRAGSITTKDLNSKIFPYDAFEFDNPNKTSNPCLYMRDPWSLQIGSSTLDWTDSSAIELPSEAWYASLLSTSETTLECASSDTTYEPSSSEIYASASGVHGVLSYDLSSLDNWTVLLRFNSSWVYLNSDGSTNTDNIEVDDNVITIHTDLSYTLPFTLSYTAEFFKELVLFDSVWTWTSLKSLINGGTTFQDYYSSDEAYPTLTLTKYGLLWKCGNKYVKLGNTASFHEVNLDSGNFVSGSTGWQITSDGDVEFNDGTFRGELDAASGTYNGNLEIDADDADRYISLGSDGILAEDSDGNIVHNLPSAALDDSMIYCGHYYALNTATTTSSGYHLINTDDLTPDSTTENLGSTTGTLTLSDFGLDFDSDSVSAIRVTVLIETKISYAYLRVGSTASSSSQSTRLIHSVYPKYYDETLEPVITDIYKDESLATTVNYRTVECIIPKSYDDNFYIYAGVTAQQLYPTAVTDEYCYCDVYVNLNGFYA